MNQKKQLLIDIKQYFQISSPVVLYGNNYRLRIAEKDIIDFFLKNFNIPSENKTFHVSVPTYFPSEDCAKAYIRGCFDGDGYISDNEYGHLSLCTASKDFVIGLQKIICYYSGEMIPYTETKRGNKYYPCISTTNRKARSVMKWMYSVDNCFKLERKYNRYVKLKIQSEQQDNAK